MVEEWPCDSWCAVCLTCGWVADETPTLAEVKLRVGVHVVVHGLPRHKVTAIGRCESS